MDKYIFEYFNTPESFLRKISKYGELKEDGGHPILVVPKENVRKIYAKSKGYSFIYYEEKYGRSSTYRKDFFNHNPPDGYKGKLPYWRCRYCNKKVIRKKLEVDHIIPVYKAKRFRKWKNKLPNGVNSIENLAPSCKLCNRLKGTKTGLWLIRAKLGKNKSYWMIINAGKVIAALALFVVIAVLLKNGGI